MNWFIGDWRPVWRRHPWVRAIWLLGVSATLVMIVSVPTAGIDSFAFSAGMGVSLTLGGLHEWAVARYERRDPELTTSI